MALALGGARGGRTSSGGHPLRQGLETVAVLWPILGFVIGRIVGAHKVGVEFSLGTLPLIVSQTGSRAGVLIAKAVAQSLYYVLLVTVTTAAVCAAAPVIGSNGRRLAGDEFIIWLAVGRLLAVLVTMALLGVVALVTTCVVRSSAAEIMVTLMLQLMSSSMFGETLAPYLPWHHIQQANSIVRGPARASR